MAIKEIDGKPVLDAKHQIVLHITSEDCQGADPKRPMTCAAAKAIKREMKASDCRVHLSRVYIRQNKGNWQRYKVPAALRSEIVAFDRGGIFEPGDYVLSPLQPSLQNGARPNKKRKPPQGKKVPQRGNRAKRHLTANVRTGPA